MGRFVLDAGDDGELGLEGSITIGRHIDNDLIVAGEDVRDFHLRVEVEERCCRAHPLNNAAVVVNDRPLDTDIELIAGDVVEIGASRMRVRFEPSARDHMHSWRLEHLAAQPQPTGAPAAAIPLTAAETTVGRGEDADIRIPEGHVSRVHALLLLRDGALWVQDMGSSNGTFLNGARLARGARLLHGDELSFDTKPFQVLATGDDLTPPRELGKPLFSGEDSVATPTLTDFDEVVLETTEMAVVDWVPPPQIEADVDAGCYLIGMSPPHRNVRHMLEVGEYVVGRQPGCDIVVDDLGVSVRHAEVTVRAEGCFASDLMSTNGLWINGQRTQATALKDGDVIAFGTSQWGFRRIELDLASETRNSRSSLAIAAAVLVLLSGAMVWWLL